MPDLIETPTRLQLSRCAGTPQRVGECTIALDALALPLPPNERRLRARAIA